MFPDVHQTSLSVQKQQKNEAHLLYLRISRWKTRQAGEMWKNSTLSYCTLLPFMPHKGNLWSHLPEFVTCNQGVTACPKTPEQQNTADPAQITTLQICSWSIYWGSAVHLLQFQVMKGILPSLEHRFLLLQQFGESAAPPAAEGYPPAFQSYLLLFQPASCSPSCKSEWICQRVMLLQSNVQQVTGINQGFMIIAFSQPYSLLLPLTSLQSDSEQSSQKQC